MTLCFGLQQTSQASRSELFMELLLEVKVSWNLTLCRIHRNAGPHNLEGLNVQRLRDPLNLRTLSKVDVTVTG